MFKRIYLDSSVVLAYANESELLPDDAILIIDQAEEIHSSILVDLETPAPSKASGHLERASRINEALGMVTHFHSIDEPTWKSAMTLASRKRGLSAADAIHLAICEMHEAVFLNAERPDRAPNQVEGVESHSIYQKSN